MLKAIETSYKGYRFRSRLEARWAVFFDALDVPWEYEKEGYDLGEAGWYLPDFWLPREKKWVEIKPAIEDATPASKIYLAGKVRPNWREGLDVKGHEVTGPDLIKEAHDIGLHRCGSDEKSDIIASCLQGIDNANVVFAWIDSTDCHGTLIEIGYAHAKGKRIFVCFSRNLDLAETWNDHYDHDSSVHDMWFAEAISSQHTYSNTPQDGLNYFLPPLTEAEEKCKVLSQQNECLLVHGNPYLNEYLIAVFAHGRCWNRGYHFELSPSIEKERLQAFSSQWGYTITRSRLMKAYDAARSARFEHRGVL